MTIIWCILLCFVGRWANSVLNVVSKAVFDWTEFRLAWALSNIIKPYICCLTNPWQCKICISIKWLLVDYIYMWQMMENVAYECGIVDPSCKLGPIRCSYKSLEIVNWNIENFAYELTYIQTLQIYWFTPNVWFNNFNYDDVHFHFNCRY